MGIFSDERLRQLEADEVSRVGPYTVMIVDDEDANRAVMRTILKPYFNLVEAGDGREALDRIAELEDPELLACIVSDHRMPRMTGLQLFEETHRSLPRTCRIIVTGFVDIDTILDSINKAEIYKFIVKPYDVSSFLLTVKRAVEAYDMQRQLIESRAQLEHKVAIRTHELAEERARLMAANHELQRSAREILALYNNASCGYHSLDRAGTFTHINDTELRWLGRTREEVVGKLKLGDVLTPRSFEAILQSRPHIARHGWVVDLNDIEAEFVHAEGHVVPVLFSATSLSTSAEHEALCRFTVFDITDRKIAEDRIRHMANHDPLTGLPNRMLLQDRMAQALANAARTGCRIAIAYIDLDHFKQINDTLGHQVGDQLLKTAARRLSACVRGSDTLARIGGDEFLMILPFFAHCDVTAIIAGVVQTLADPFLIEPHTLRISASVGTSIYPDDGTDMDVLMRHADTAMYAAKVNGRNNAVAFVREESREHV